MSKCVFVVVCLVGVAFANHGHHGHQHGHGHHHGHEEAAEEQPQVQAAAAEGNVATTFPGGSFFQITRNFASQDGPTAQPLLLDDQPQEPNPNQPPNPDRFHPFNPRFEVSRVEIDDGEWLQELAGEFRGSGLLSSSDSDLNYFLLKNIPGGVININYDIHACVHMGTQLEASETVYPPTAISYPVDETSEALHTLLMIDVDNRNRLHWLVVNIPGPKVSEGQIVRGYNSPHPAPGTGPHRFVFLAMQQLAGRFDNVPTNTEDICKNDGRDNFDLELFKSRQRLSEPFAANYFTVEYDPFVENITPVCHGPNTRPTLA